jgi:hypothetical protein
MTLHLFCAPVLTQLYFAAPPSTVQPSPHSQPQLLSGSTGQEVTPVRRNACLSSLDPVGGLWGPGGKAPAEAVTSQEAPSPGVQPDLPLALVLPVCAWLWGEEPGFSHRLRCCWRNITARCAFSPQDQRPA